MLTPARLEIGGHRAERAPPCAARWWCPFQVIATGVVSGQPAAISVLPMSTGPVSAPRITRVPVAGRRSRLERRLASTTRTSARAVGGQRDAGVGGHRGRRGHARARSRSRTPALAQAAASSAARQNSERVAGEQPDHQLARAWPRLDQRFGSALGVRGVGQLGVARAAGRRSRLAHAPAGPTTRSAWPSRSARAQGQQALVARAGADEGAPGRPGACRARGPVARSCRGRGVHCASSPLLDACAATADYLPAPRRSSSRPPGGLSPAASPAAGSRCRA